MISIIICFIFLLINNGLQLVKENDDNPKKGFTENLLFQNFMTDSTEELTLSTSIQPIYQITLPPDLQSPALETQNIESYVFKNVTDSELLINNFTFNSTEATTDFTTEITLLPGLVDLFENNENQNSSMIHELNETIFDSPNEQNNFVKSNNFTQNVNTSIAEKLLNSTYAGNTSELSDSFNYTLIENMTTSTVKPTRSYVHPCLIDFDDIEPEFQRYACSGNKIISLIATTFLLTMILFGFTKILCTHGCLPLLDVRRAGVSYPQRPEVFVLICSTLPIIFTTIARPLFWPYHSRYLTFINSLGCMRARLFFDLFIRTATVYHMIYWAFRTPVNNFMWKTYVRYKAFRLVWTPDHIKEVLQDKFGLSKELKMRKGFQNTPEYMLSYSQYLQSGLPMQYFQFNPKSENRSPTLEGLHFSGSPSNSGQGFQGTHLGTQKMSSSASKQGVETDVLQRVNLGVVGPSSSTGSSPRGSNPGYFVGGMPASNLPRSQTNLSTHNTGLPLSRNTSFRSSIQGRASPNLHTHNDMPPMDKTYGYHLTPGDALVSIDALRSNLLDEKQGSVSPDSRHGMPQFFENDEYLQSMFPLLDGANYIENKKVDVAKIPPPTREFIYICKHSIPGTIYLISLILTFPSIFALNTYEYESRGTVFYFFFDLIFIIIFPIVAIVGAFYKGVLSTVQLNGGTKMTFRLRCYYVNFILLSLPMLISMLIATAYRWMPNKDIDSGRYATGIIISLTAYHTNFVLKATVYTTGCNCICCSTACLARHENLNNCLIRVTTPRIKPNVVEPGSSGSVIQIEEPENE